MTRSGSIRSGALLIAVVVLLSGCQYVGIVGPRVSFHGDSVGAQAEPQITRRLTRAHRLLHQSVERADIADLLPRVRRLMRQGPVPEMMVIELGSGDAYERHGNERMRRDIRHLLDLVRRVPCVRWLSLKIAGVNGFYEGYVDRADDFNRILARAITHYPNAHVAPYGQWSRAHPGAFKADGLHHTRRGKSLYAHFIESVVNRCP